MTSLTHSRPSPRIFIWVAACVAPFAWAAAVSMMFSMIDETCVQGSRWMVWVSAATCILVAVTPAVLIAPARRSAASAPLIRDLVVVGSIVFAMVMLVTAVPILTLDECASQTSALARNSSL